MSSPGHPHADDGHHHHHHHHRHHRPVRTGTARPDRPVASLLALSLGARLAGAGGLTLAVWAAILWATR